MRTSSLPKLPQLSMTQAPSNFETRLPRTFGPMEGKWITFWVYSSRSGWEYSRGAIYRLGVLDKWSRLSLRVVGWRGALVKDGPWSIKTSQRWGCGVHGSWWATPSHPFMNEPWLVRPLLDLGFFASYLLCWVDILFLHPCLICWPWWFVWTFVGRIWLLLTKHVGLSGTTCVIIYFPQQDPIES